MPKLRLTGRKAVLVGVIAAAASAAAITVAAPATAAPTQQRTACTDNVRVRSEPSETAPVVGSCRSGEVVVVKGAPQNGYAHMVNPRQGWVSVDYLRTHDASSRDEDSDFDTESSFDEDNDNKDESCTFTDDRYHYDGDDRYKCRNGKRDYDDNYNDSNNNDDNDDDNKDKVLGGLLGN